MKDRLYLALQFPILAGARTFALLLMPVKTAEGDFQRLGQLLDLIISFECVPELEALFRLPSETMAKAFFKMSRYRRR